MHFVNKAIFGQLIKMAEITAHKYNVIYKTADTVILQTFVNNVQMDFLFQKLVNVWKDNHNTIAHKIV